MLGFIWNLRGAGDDRKKRLIRETIIDRNIDFLGLQETMKQNFTRNDLHTLCGGKNFIWQWAAARGRSGGILVRINQDSFEYIEHEIGDYFVRVLVYDKKADYRWNLIVVYGDAQPNGKAAFLAEFARVCHDNSAPCLVGCDFNIIRKPEEKNKPGNTGHWSFVFNAIIENAGLRELPLNGRNFTWGNNLEAPTFEKLDRVLMCPDWDEKYPLTIVSALEREISDHTPLIIDTGIASKNPPIFRFENAWFEREGLKEIVENNWNNSKLYGSAIDKWQHNLGYLEKIEKDGLELRMPGTKKIKKGNLQKLDIIDKECEVHGLNACMRQEQKELRAQLDRLLR